MILMARLAMLAGGIGALLAATGRPEPVAMILSVVAGLSMFGALAAAHRSMWRPWSDLVAWSAGAVVLVALGDPRALLGSVIIATAGLAAMLVALHVPATDSPTRGHWGATIVWPTASAIVALIAWGPAIMAAGANVAVLEPLSSGGMALRLLGVALAAWSVVGILHLRSRFTRGSSPDPEGVRVQ